MLGSSTHTYMHCMIVTCVHAAIRQDKLNSQFIVTNISILHAGGWSFFRFQTSREESAGKLCSNRNRQGPPLISAIGGWGSKCYTGMFTVLKQRIQFAPPYWKKYSIVLSVLSNICMVTRLHHCTHAQIALNCLLMRPYQLDFMFLRICGSNL